MYLNYIQMMIKKKKLKLIEFLKQLILLIILFINKNPMKGQKLEIRNNGNSNTTIKYQNFNFLL